MKSKFLIIAVVVFLVLFLVMLFSPAESSSFTPRSLYADNGISITLQGANTAGLKLSIDNQGSESIHVYGDSAVINGFSIPALLMQDVYSGKTANSTVHFDSAVLSAAGISTVADVNLYIHITDENERDIYDGRVSATLDNSYVQPVDSSGVVVYSSDDYFISARPNDLDNPRNAAIIYVENKTDNRLSLVCDSLSINGKMLNGMFSLQNVEAQSRAQFILDPYTLKMLNDDNAAAMSVSHVDDMSIRLGLTPWHGTTISTADMFSTDVIQIIGK